MINNYTFVVSRFDEENTFNFRKYINILNIKNKDIW